METEILTRINKLEADLTAHVTASRSIEGELRGLRVALAVSRNKPLPPVTTNGHTLASIPGIDRWPRVIKNGKTQWVRDAINELQGDTFTLTNVVAALKAKGHEVPRFRVSTILNKLAHDRKEIGVQKPGAGRTAAIYKKAAE